MEMISASKMKKMQSRLMVSKPFVEKLQQVIYNLNISEESIQNESLIKERDDVSRVLILSRPDQIEDSAVDIIPTLSTILFCYMTR